MENLCVIFQNYDFPGVNLYAVNSWSEVSEKGSGGNIFGDSVGGCHRGDHRVGVPC